MAQHSACAALQSAAVDPTSYDEVVTRLLVIQDQQQALAFEREHLNQWLQQAHGRGELLQRWSTDPDGDSYSINRELSLHRRPGHKQWSYSLQCKRLKRQLASQQLQEQQNGTASYTLEPSSWEVKRCAV